LSASEDFEQGLRRELEAHVGSRLRARQEEILRVQGQIDEMLAGVAERLTADTDDEHLSLLISEQLRRAREQGMREAAQSATQAGGTSDVALLKAAVEDIDAQRSQADILNALVNRAASFAPRVAFFVVKNERATGWRARGLEGTVGDNGVREISLPLSTDSALARVYHSRETWSGAPGASAGDNELTSKLGDEPPRRVVAVPLVARDKCVAVLYADSAGLEGEAINLEALETLVRVTGMAVELLATKRPAVQAQPRRESAGTAVTVTETAPAAEPAPRPEAEAQPAAPRPEAEPQQAPSRLMPPQSARVESPAADHAPAAEAERDETPAEETVPAAASMAPLADAPVTPTVSASAAEVTPPVAPAAAEEAREERGIAPFAPPAEAAPATSFSAPLGSRRLGQDVELPIEVSEEERRYHQDARRFARLLVSEIKLYNEQKVKDGFERGDLYERLREEIDRSRQMYAKRVHPSVAPRYDYFHHELVATLAKGDDARLGAGYPGTAVSA
jgi:hypothetical protein